MVNKSKKIYILGSCIIALASVFLVYFLLMVSGVVQVKNEIITISSGSIEATYNGLPVRCESVEVTQGELRDGHSIKAYYTGELTNVGSTANTYTFTIVDSLGVDVTDKYNIDKIEGTITVNKRPISLRGSNASKVYDGKPLSTDSTEYTWVSGDLIEGHSIEVSSHGEQVDAGIGENKLDVQVYDSNGNVMTQNYDIQVVPGALTVKPIPLVVSSGSANKRYDGSPLTDGFWQLEQGKLLDLDKDGKADHEIIAETNGTVTEPGKVDNTFSYIRVIDKVTGEDVTHNYEIDPQYGVLEIKSVALVFRSNNIHKYYDGLPLEVSQDDVELISGSLFEGHTYEVKMRDITEVDAGKYDYSFDVIIKDKNGETITDNYDITYEEGIAEIKGADIVIKTGSNTKVYDGTTLSSKEYEILSGKEMLEEKGVRLEIVSFTEVSEVFFDKNGKLQGVNNEIVFKLINAKGEDVTKNYNITDNLIYGSLIITQKSIKVVTPSDSKVYDGTDLKCDPSKKSEVVIYTDELNTGLIDGHTLYCTGLDAVLSAETAISDKNSSYVYNVPTLEIKNSKGEIVTHNYSISNEKFGKLSFSMNNIKVFSKDADKEYDGNELTCYEYGFIFGSGEEAKEYAQDEKFLNGHYMEYTNTSKLIEGGSEYNRFNAVIYYELNGKKVDVSKFFNITYEYGILKVTPQIIYVSTGSQNWTYDGQEHEYLAFSLSGTSLMNDLPVEISVVSGTKVKNADKSGIGVNNVLTFEVKDKNTGKESLNYQVKIKEYGKLLVDPFMFGVATYSHSFEYTGKDFNGIAKGLYVSEGSSLSINSFSYMNVSLGINEYQIKGTGETFVIGDLWTSTSLGTVINKPNYYDILNDRDISTMDNYIILEQFGYITVTNPNYDYTIAPNEIKVPLSELTSGYEVDMQYAIENGYILEKNVILGLDVLIKQGYTYKYEISGSAKTPGTHKNVLKIEKFELYAPTDKGQSTNLVGTEGFRFKFENNKIVIYEFSVTITTQTISKVYDGNVLSGKELDYTVTGLQPGHTLKIDEETYVKVQDVGQSKVNKFTYTIIDSSGKDVTDSYYRKENWGKLSLTAKTVEVTFDDPYVEVSSSKDNGKGVYAEINDFEEGSYQVTGLVDGHKLEYFRTDYTTESGVFEIAVFKIVDSEGNDVTNNYVVQSDYIEIEITD